MPKRAYEFWEERLGLAAIRSRLLERPIPAEVGWFHTLGSVALTLLVVLVLTGILLALNYSPSTEHAYHSVRYIEHNLPLGRVIRGLHHWATSFLVVVVMLHLLHTFTRFAFRRPRELTWCTGTLILLVVLTFAFTGYLLPWDEKAYWATVVGTSIVGQFPGLGAFLLYVVRGSEAVGTATLTRFYAAHVTLLPFLLATLLGAHFYLVVLHGIARKSEPSVDPCHADTPGIQPGPSTGTSKNDSATVPFWPDVLAMDATAILFVLALLFFVALQFGAPLEAPADPTNTRYVPRPDWYFLPLFELLTFFTGRGEAIAVVVIPSVAVLVLVGLPWWAARLVRSRGGTVSLLATMGLAFLGVVGLGVAGGMRQGPALSPTDPTVARGRLLYDQLGCAHCHSIRGVGGMVGPDLTMVGFRRPDLTWLANHLQEPRSLVPTSPMPAFPLEGRRLNDLVAFLLSQGNDLRYSEAAPELFAQRCMACHRLAGRGGTYGPDLGKVGRLRTVAFIHQYVEQPRSLNQDARMAPVVSLTHEEVEDVARYVVATALVSWGPRD